MSNQRTRKVRLYSVKILVSNLSLVPGVSSFPPAPASTGSDTVLDLSTKKKPEDSNNNIKTEEVSREAETETDGSLRARKYSELSECSVASEVPAQGGPAEPTASSLAEDESSNSNNKRVNTSPLPESKKMKGGSPEES